MTSLADSNPSFPHRFPHHLSHLLMAYAHFPRSAPTVWRPSVTISVSVYVGGFVLLRRARITAGGNRQPHFGRCHLLADSKTSRRQGSSFQRLWLTLVVLTHFPRSYRSRPDGTKREALCCLAALVVSICSANNTILDITMMNQLLKVAH
jgi:hypothetical protein